MFARQFQKITGKVTSSGFIPPVEVKSMTHFSNINGHIIKSFRKCCFQMKLLKILESLLMFKIRLIFRICLLLLKSNLVMICSSRLVPMSSIKKLIKRDKVVLTRKVITHNLKGFKKDCLKDKFNQHLIKIERIQWEELNLFQVVFKMLLISKYLKRRLKQIVNQQVQNKQINLDHKQAIIQLQLFRIKQPYPFSLKIKVKQSNKKKFLLQEMTF